MDSVKNVFKNTVTPITRSQDSAIGFTIDTLLETTITWTMRYFLGMRVGFLNLLFTVILAAPLVSAGSFIKIDMSGSGALQTWYVRFLLGIQTVPSYFLAQYVMGTVQNGFYVPKFRIMDILVTVISRTLSRVIIMVAMDQNVPGAAKWTAFFETQLKQLKEGNLAA